MKTKKLLLTFAIALFALISGCATDDFVETVGVCPVVVSTIPAPGAIGVPLNQIISVTFNEAMNPETIQTSFTVENGTPISGKITYSGNVATFTPGALLAANTVYTGRVKTSAKDINGNALQVEYVWKFSTGVAPFVTLTDPAPLATNVPLNKIITATFNTAMDPATLVDPATTFTVKEGLNSIAGVVTYSGTMVSFKPTLLLLPGKTYTATISTAAKNVAGVPMASNYTWTFSTPIVPFVVSTDPAPLAIDVQLNKTITATFNIAMDPATLVDPATTFSVKDQLNNNIVGVVTYSGLTASFNPNLPLLSARTYTCTITTAAKSTSGIPMATNYVWTFSTALPVSGGTIPPAASGVTMGAFGGNAGITNQGLFTRINNGGIGTTAAASLITGFTDLTNGAVYTVTPLNNGLVQGGITVGSAAAPELVKANAAYNSISPASKPGGIDPGAGELGRLTLAPGIYKAASGTFKITNGDLTLDAQGDPNAVWIFQTAAALTVGDAAPSSVKLLNGAQAKNVYWYVGSTAVINYAGGGVMVGTIIANSGVTLSSPGNNTNAVLQTVLNGKAISLVSSVTMVNTIINVQ